MLFRFILWMILIYVLIHVIRVFVYHFKQAFQSNQKIHGADRNNFNHSKYEDVEEAKFREIKTEEKKSHLPGDRQA
jgi:hypothetical protein